MFLLVAAVGRSRASSACPCADPERSGRAIAARRCRLNSQVALNRDLAGASIATYHFSHTGRRRLKRHAVTLASLATLKSAASSHRVAIFCPDALTSVGGSSAPGIDEVLPCPERWQHGGLPASGMIAQHGSKPSSKGGTSAERNGTCFTVRAEEMRLMLVAHALNSHRREAQAAASQPRSSETPRWLAVIETDMLWLAHPLSIFAPYGLAQCDLVLTVRKRQEYLRHHKAHRELYTVNTGV